MLDPEDEGNTFFRNAETTHPTIRHIPKDLSPQQHCSENHKSCKYSFLLLSASQVHNLFQSEFSTECDLVPLLSVSSDNPAAAYVFLLVFRSVAETGGGEGRGWKAVQITGTQGPTMLRMFLSFSVLSLSVDCTN